jgi:FkbM family methyltransferase
VHHSEAMRRIRELLARRLELLLDLQALHAILTWPVFGGDCFRMVAALSKQGIVPRTVIDVGANVGQFAVAAAKLWPQVGVHSFEPLPGAFALLKKHVDGLTVRAYQLALGETEGESALHVTTGNCFSSFLPPSVAFQAAFPEARDIATVGVRVSTLDREFAEAEVESPTLLKLDVQGYEAAVLRGGSKTLRRIDWIVVETAFRVRYEGEEFFPQVMRLLENNDFCFKRPVSFHVDSETDEVVEIDALFERNDGEPLLKGPKRLERAPRSDGAPRR